MKILMVCLGNICRSPIAEGVLQHKSKEAGLGWTVESAGTNNYHIGEPPHHLSQKVARLNGVNICEQRARKFVPEDFIKFDRIYAMAEDVLEDMKRIAGQAYDSKKAMLFLNELYPGKDMSVPDPWYGPEPGYHDVYELIDKTCDVIISRYSSMSYK